MKKQIAIFVMLGVLCSSFAFFVSSATVMPTFEDLLEYHPPNWPPACYNSKVIFQSSNTLPINVEVPYPLTWDVQYKPQCKYRIDASGTTVGTGTGRVILVFEQEQQLIIGRVSGTESASFYWNPNYGIPQGVGLMWTSPRDGNPDLQYQFKIYEECPCSLPPLYPKVDIEQFTVTGGSTIIRDGKILSSFEIAPGVQQTFIQVENRGFFTQNEAMIKFLGLPEGVTVDITPETQKIKAHNIGTYSASFTVGPNVSSGTYDVTMVAYSSTGTFDIIQFKFVVP